ncbi:RING-H2 finger protein ATL63-like [Panicum miliaceum]|uniref:RING-type E3 ubiquitin transferase n=1 Tax=Panicum miliaceum TaxID=4540 RepID=A0A3L6S2R8_PANMI|nr:RING-H2 finger protein ATL63-like [Panicum miliaceum]
MTPALPLTAATCFPPAPCSAAAHRDDGSGGGDDGYEDRVLIPLFLASALLFFVTYQLFGLAAAGGVVALFVVLALAAHRVRLSRGFPFLHLSWDVSPGGGGVLFRPGADAGMDAAAISALPAAFGYKRDEHAATGWAQCVICLGLVRAGEAVRRLQACGHLFHAGCVDKWLRAHATCPLCRAAVAPEQPV